MTGFSNVTSMEYLVTHQLYETLKDYLEFYYPIQFRNLRDNTILSESNKMNNLGMIAIFVRRPKTDVIDSDELIFSFQSHHFEQVSFFRSLNISTLFALPISTSILNIGFGADVKWVSFSGINNIDSNSIIKVFDGNISNGLQCILEYDHIKLYDLLNVSEKYSWRNVLDIMSKWNHNFKYDNCHNYRFMNPLQKPIFIIYRLKAWKKINKFKIDME